MNSHNPVEFRDKSRRIGERRSHPRRVIKHAFGSEEWVKAVRESYAFWPKSERRYEERRSVSRRTLERRAQLQKFRRMSLRQRTLRKQSQHQILTAEEKNMLRDLNNRY